MTLPKNTFLFIVVIALLILSGCIPKTSSTMTPISPTQVSEPDYKFNQDLILKGDVVTLGQLNLSFSISGHMIELFVEQGDYVQKGDLIAKLDTTTLLADIARAEGEVAVAQAYLESVSTGPQDAEIAKAAIQITAIASQRPLSAAQATAQVSDLAMAQADLDLLLDQPFPEDVALAQARLDQAQLNLEILKSRLNLASLSAPSDGTVTKVYVKAYEYANMGQPIIQVSDLSELIVQIEINDFEIKNIDIGNTYPVMFEALPEVEVEGRVLSIMPNEENGDKNLIALMGLETVPEGLLWGMTADVIIPSE